MLTADTRDLLINGVTIFFRLLNFLIIARVLISWFPINPNGPIVTLLRTLTDPIIAPVRSMVDKSPLGGGGAVLDFSPVIALFILQIIQTIIISLL